MKTYELVIIGAGPAGLSAASKALESGVTPMIIDENAKAGGRIYAQSTLKEDGFNTKIRKKAGQLLNSGLSGAMFANKEQVLGIFPDNTILMTRKDGTARIKYKSLIIAPGARELSIPFPGWTLPGVMTSGCAQTMIKTQGLFPDKAVVAGTGPLQLILADQIIKAGGKVLAFVETGSMLSWLKESPALFGHWGLAAELSGCMMNLIKNRVPLYFGSMVSAAKGQAKLQEVEISRIRGGLKKNIDTDVLCIGYGFLPSHELSLAAGARQEFVNGRWIPVCDPYMQTSVDGVFVAGDSAGINGARMAEFQGALAGVGAAKYLGQISGQAADKHRRSVLKKIRKEEKLKEAFDRIMQVPGNVWNLAEDDTIICRCEDLVLEELKGKLKESGGDINEFKRLSRAGMGLCQGRTCATYIKYILAQSSGKDIDQTGVLTPRPPFKPVTLGQIAKDYTEH